MDGPIQGLKKLPGPFSGSCQSGVKLCFDFGGGDLRGTGEVDNFALIPEEVERSFQSSPMTKDICMVFFPRRFF